MTPSSVKARLQQRIRAERRAVLVVNTRSRRGAHAFARAKELLLQEGFTLDAAFPVRDPVRLQEVVRSVVDKGHPLVIIGGGDGTLSSVVDLFADRDVALGLLPLGTANSFARELGIPIALDAAVKVIAEGKVGDVDLALINGDYFANTATLGLASTVARSTPHSLKKLFGKAAYVFVGAAKFLSFHPFDVRVTESGQVKHFTALQVLLANGRFFGGMLVAADADPQSRNVTVQIVTGQSRWSLIRAWWAIAWGRRPDAEAVVEFTTRDAVFETKPRQYVSVDGEVVAQTPFHLTMGLDALKVIVPEEFDDR